MNKLFTEETGFYGNTTPQSLIQQYGSPLYVYNEGILRERCREMADLIPCNNFKANYSIKANSNLEFLKIIRQEGLHADAMSPGEIYVLIKAGFKSQEIFYVGNNVSEEELRYAINSGVTVSIDSLSQLKLFGEINKGGNVAVRFNPGIGAGHHEKVVTAGKNTKFGVEASFIPQVKDILNRYNLRLVGINQHIGSLFMDGDVYIKGVEALLKIAGQFENLEFIDLGGGFGIPYRKQEDQKRLELKNFGQKLASILDKWSVGYGKNVTFKTEPGRYIVAECGALLGTVYAKKMNHGRTYVGTDIGLNVLIRPAMYDSHHEIEVYRGGAMVRSGKEEIVTVVGNICESGDIIAKDRKLPEIFEGDIISVIDAGAYGYSMASNYNNRLRPAEVLIRADGSPALIRRREILEDLIKNFEI